LDADERHFFRQHFREAFHAPFCGGIWRTNWRSDAAPHRRELDDVASTLLAHYGYRGFRDDDRSEQVCFDLPPKVRELRLFNGIHVA
jgi:hypothetical protein